MLLTKPKEVNIDYLCAIRQKDNHTTFERIEIPSSTELITTLEGMVENDNASLLDMQAQMDYNFPRSERNYMNCIIPYYYYDSYIEGVSYPASKSYDDYNEELNKLSEELKMDYESKCKDFTVENLSKYVDEKISAHKKYTKRNYLYKAKRFIKAKNYIQSVNRIKEDPDIRMYSTESIGWSDYTYKVTDDIIIKLSTNFGYGNASYFFLWLKYKGIDILPYSYVVKYYYANRMDIHRYTRMYDVTRDSWNLSFKFVEETANLAADDEESFVNRYILNEINQMVDGLKKIILEPKAYIENFYKREDEQGYGNRSFITVHNMTDDDIKCYNVYQDEMQMVIKAEKVTGALVFLDNLTELSKLFPVISDSIEDIKAIALNLLPEMTEKMSNLDDEIVALTGKETSVEQILESLKAAEEEHKKQIDAIYEEASKNDNNISRSAIESDYLTMDNGYQDLKTNIAEAINNLNMIRNELRMRKGFRSSLAECVQRVNDAELEKSTDTLK